MKVTLARARSRRRPSASRVVAGTGYHLLGGSLATVFLLPLVWALLNSLKTAREANQSPPTWLPQSWSLENYANLAAYGSGLGVYLWNTIFLATVVMAGTIAVTTLAGYGFARFQFPAKRLIFGSTLVILMVPYATILIPLYIVLGWLHLSNTLIGLALVLVMFHLPFGTFLMRNSFEALPIELEESARVDGCGTAGVFRRITLPLAIPSIVTVGLYTFITTWNEFLAPLIFLNDGDQYTLPIMLVNFYARQEGEIDFGALQAGAIVSIAPVLVLYLLLQRYYVSGITSGALRG